MSFLNIYNRFAQTYDFVIGPLLRHGHKMAVHAMDLKPGMKLLEVGIGTGLTLPKFPSDIEVTGIDLSEPMLQKAKKRVHELDLHNVQLHVMSAEDMLFKDNSFDAVFAPSVFSVFTNPEKALDEMVRVCKPEGVICIVSHFAGDTGPQKLADNILDPLTQKLAGYRMKTPRGVVEAHNHSKIILKKQVFPIFNFGTLYLLRKK